MKTIPRQYQCTLCQRKYYNQIEKCMECGGHHTIIRVLAPIGIMPKNIWILKRIEELQAAIRRHLEAEWPVPHEWYNELEDHIRGLENARGNEEEFPRKDVLEESKSSHGAK